MGRFEDFQDSEARDARWIASQERYERFYDPTPRCPRCGAALVTTESGFIVCPENLEHVKLRRA